MGHAETHQMMHGKFNERDWDGMKANMADDVTFHDMAQGSTGEGPDAAVEYLQAWPAGFSDATPGDPEYMEGPNHSVAFFTAQGTNDGEFAGMPASGKTISVPFCEVVRYTDDGKVASSRLYYDAATMMQQLGVMPAQQA
jgi:steroid delta-isomerase-like uncharacterized protein